MDADRLTTKSQEAVSTAVRRAATEGHPEVAPVHLLLALLDQGDDASTKFQPIPSNSRCIHTSIMSNALKPYQQ